MKVSEILALGKMGFSINEIRELMKEDSPAAQAAPEQDPAAQDETPAAPTQNSTADLMGAIKNLTEALQASNIRTESMPQAQAAADTVESVLSSIINPKN